MESNKAKGSARVVALAILLVVIIGLSASGIYYNSLKTKPISQYLRSDLPMLDLRIQFTTLEGDPITPEHSKLLDDKPSSENTFVLPGGCPALVGGDTQEARELNDKDRKIDEKCPKFATWYVKRHPIGFSLYLRDGKKLLSLFDENKEVQRLFESKFFQGIFHDPLYDSDIRAEDLRLQGIQGAFLKPFVREAVAAHGELHYDSAHGNKGFVFSFIRRECPMASKILPVLSKFLARSGYRVPKLTNPVLEMRIGLQRLFLTESEGRVYVSNGLEALLNVLETLYPMDSHLLEAPLVLTIRAESFVEKFLPVIANTPSFTISIGFELSTGTGGFLQFPSGKLTQKLLPSIFKGVFAGIPHDAFAALATSHLLPVDMTTEQWQQLTVKGPGDKLESLRAGEVKEGGFAIVWDLSSAGGRITQMGVVIANTANPDETGVFKKYFADPDLTASCGGGTVFLAATSGSLLSRMKESCEGQSLSVLNWERGSRTKAFESNPFFMFMNPGAGMRELFLAGGGKSEEKDQDLLEPDETDPDLDSSGEFEPQWKKEYESAKAVMRQEGETVFKGLPIFAYSGTGAADGQTVHLKGFTVQQGASR